MVSALSQMDLYVWNGDTDWGLPSMDLKSFQMLAYAKFAGAPVNVKKTCNPFSSPTGCLPVYKTTHENITEFSKFCAFLRRHNYTCDYELSPRQCADVVAYEHLLTEKLYPAVAYLWWVEPKSHSEVIHKWYFQNVPIPHKFYVPWKLKRLHEEFISVLFDDPQDIQMVETELHKNAQECLTMLSNRLGDNDFFFGRSPSVIDAIVYPYLCLLLKVDLKVCVLQNHLKASPNLTRYVTRLTQRYFSHDLKSPGPPPKADVSGVQEDVPNKGRNFILSALVAGSAMFGYAVAAGLVQVDMHRSWDTGYGTEHQYEEDEDDGTSSQG